MKEQRFDDAFRQQLDDLVLWRRDVRRFTRAPVAPDLIDRLLDLAQLSPSVGNSQPWRWIAVESAAARGCIRSSFCTANKQALAGYADDRAALYARLKLEGLDAAPVQLAAFCDRATAQGHGLGLVTMPEALDYSVVSAIMTFWLAARAHGLGVGWISILDPGEVTAGLDVPKDWRLIAYLCVGWPQEEHTDPELERFGWQGREPAGRVVWRR